MTQSKLESKLESMITEIFSSIQECATSVQELLQCDDSGYLASTNASGDTQLAVDVRADMLLEQALLKLPCVKGVCSEEKSSALYKQGANIVESTSLHALESGLLVAYDPLDGSSLFDSNLSVGSIFGIYDSVFSASALVAAAYIVYGPRLEVVLAYKEAKHYAYHYACNEKQWRSKGALQLESRGKLNAPGGTQKNWEVRHKELVESLFAKGYRLRYSGGMVPDLHQILCKRGGLFSYPATSDAPSGKLRKLFEVFPFAFIYERAGGDAIDGQRQLLSLPCDSLHESTPCFLGSKEEIAQVRTTYMK